MRYVLENDRLRVEIDSFGAELKSVKRKSDGKEYMWYADKKYWGRTSPVLFPFVGNCRNKEYRYGGKTYAIGQHGFARDMEHTMESQTADTIWFSLHSNEETMEKYPFAFVLKIGYNLTGNELKVMWKVENPDTKTLYFSIGAHPAFLCPFHDEESKLGYGLQFAGLKELHHHGNTPDTGLAVMSEDIVIPLEDEKVYFTPGFFDRCTYMVEGKQTGEVSLVTPDGKPYVTMDFDAPLFAIWSPEGKDAPFVCIEPWYGRCDADDFEGTLEERAYENAVEPKQTFEASYSIRYL